MANYYYSRDGQFVHHPSDSVVYPFRCFRCSRFIIVGGRAYAPTLDLALRFRCPSCIRRNYRRAVARQQQLRYRRARGIPDNVARRLFY